MNVLDKMEFCDQFDAVQAAVHKVNRDNGFWGVPDRLEIVASGSMTKEDAGKVEAIVMSNFLGMITTEVAEAIEAVRKSPKSSWATLEKDSLTRELADAVIRIMDFAEAYELPLSNAILVGLAHNQTRGHLHGNKRL